MAVLPPPVFLGLAAQIGSLGGTLNLPLSQQMQQGSSLDGLQCLDKERQLMMASAERRQVMAEARHRALAEQYNCAISPLNIVTPSDTNRFLKGTLGKKTIRQELQEETDVWLTDVF
jgi:hypothetical protein